MHVPHVTSECYSYCYLSDTCPFGVDTEILCFRLRLILESSIVHSIWQIASIVMSLASMAVGTDVWAITTTAGYMLPWGNVSDYAFGEVFLCNFIPANFSNTRHTYVAHKTFGFSRNTSVLCYCRWAHSKMGIHTSWMALQSIPMKLSACGECLESNGVISAWNGLCKQGV